MNLRRFVSVIMVWGVFCLVSSPESPAFGEDAFNRLQFDNEVLQQSLSTYVEHLPALKTASLESGLGCDISRLRYFYQVENQNPLWVSAQGINANAEKLIRIIGRAAEQGLDPADYHIDEIKMLAQNVGQRKEIVNAPDLADFSKLELLLTDAFFLYGYHISEGRIDPAGYDLNWHIDRQKKNLSAMLDNILSQGEIAGYVEMLEPKHPGYLRLKQALSTYYEIQASGGWDPVPPEKKLKKGYRGQVVVALKNRLSASGDLAQAGEGSDDLFDENLEEAVKRFQARHGVNPDGVVGKNTFAELNVPVEDRIAQIKLNMERWRWLPASLGEHYIMVNTAGFRIQVVENEHTVKTMKAIVGKVSRPTPILSERITYLEVNPYWNVPHKIAVKDILPRIQEDPEYLVRNQIKVFADWKNGAHEVDPMSIDWANMNKRNFRFKLQQAPTETNALGQVKFMFPNEFSVYMHDTPSHALFDKDRRAFSSGCVRIEKPVELAEYLIDKNSEIDPASIHKSIDARERKILPLKTPVNIHILYWTAWVEEDGSLNFREDVYGKDHQLQLALSGQEESCQVAELLKKGKPVLSSRHNAAIRKL